ncbi:MAG: MoaD/ThiS family protein [Propionibacteriaceae bacterium]|jgi:molybdopterin converting factor small subunit|nr:MoaD/ThiS family protein [Propionibacteriaceae bacterium]
MDITYYAGAADAAGTTTVRLEAGDLTADELRAHLGAGGESLARVLASCSLLVDGSPVRDGGTLIPSGARVDVLPPFAGG